MRQRGRPRGIPTPVAGSVAIVAALHVPICCADDWSVRWGCAMRNGRDRIKSRTFDHNPTDSDLGRTYRCCVAWCTALLHSSGPFFPPEQNNQSSEVGWAVLCPSVGRGLGSIRSVDGGRSAVPGTVAWARLALGGHRLNLFYFEFGVGNDAYYCTGANGYARHVGKRVVGRLSILFPGPACLASKEVRGNQ